MSGAYVVDAAALAAADQDLLWFTHYDEEDGYCRVQRDREDVVRRVIQHLRDLGVPVTASAPQEPTDA